MLCGCKTFKTCAYCIYHILGGCETVITFTYCIYHMLGGSKTVRSRLSWSVVCIVSYFVVFSDSNLYWVLVAKAFVMHFMWNCAVVLSYARIVIYMAPFGLCYVR